MSRDYFLMTNRIGFSKWCHDDMELAVLLWGEEAVTRYICASGAFSRQEITDRLGTEIHNGEQYSVQYWPIFELATEELIGCCGLRPFKNEKDSYEIGFHLRKKYWGMGFVSEAAEAVIDYSFRVLKAEILYAGHHPQNAASKKLLTKLGFQYIGKNYYEPTGLYHPSYQLRVGDYMELTTLKVKQ